MVTLRYVDLAQCSWCRPVSKIKGSSVLMLDLFYAKMLFNDVTCIVIIDTTVNIAH